MAEINSVSVANSSVNPLDNLDLTTSNASSETETSGGGLTADFDTFLQLLTTQMKAQDPLNPMENSEFIAQLASFSSVEQQVLSNEKLDSVIAALSESSAGALAQWLDKDVRAPARAQYEGQPLTAYPPSAPTGAVTGSMVVYDADDNEVVSIPFTPGAESVTWDGKTKDDNDAEEGAYRFVAVYADEDLATTKLPAEVYDRVAEARLVDGKPVLRLSGGSEISVDDISGVRSTRQTEEVSEDAT